MGLKVHLYDGDGALLADLDAGPGDHAVLPREGEVVRITAGKDAGDYVVEYVRWRIPEADVQVLCRRSETADTWPEPDHRLG